MSAGQVRVEREKQSKVRCRINQTPEKSVGRERLAVQQVPRVNVQENTNDSPSPPTELGERAGVRWCVELNLCFYARPHLFPLPRGEVFHNRAFWFLADRPSNPSALISAAFTPAP